MNVLISLEQLLSSFFNPKTITIMKMQSNGTMKIPGKKLQDGKYIDEDISFKTQNDDELAGFGLPVSLEAGQKMIGDFQLDLIKQLQLAVADENQDAIKAVSEHPVAITLGKEALLYILTQKECEGIRFYFCNNHKGELSIVAVGVKPSPNAGSQATLASKAKDLGSPEGKLSILNNQINKQQEVEGYFLFEVGPPTRLVDTDKPGLEGNSFEEELQKIFISLR